LQPSLKIRSGGYIKIIMSITIRKKDEKIEDFYAASYLYHNLI